jgi:hypothetical protein
MISSTFCSLCSNRSNLYFNLRKDRQKAKLAAPFQFLSPQKHHRADCKLAKTTNIGTKRILLSTGQGAEVLKGTYPNLGLYTIPPPHAPNGGGGGGSAHPV